MIPSTPCALHPKQKTLQKYVATGFHHTAHATTLTVQNLHHLPALARKESVLQDDKMKRKINNKLAYCIIVLILIFIAGCSNDSKGLTSQRVAERSVPPLQTAEQIINVNETENESVETAVEVNESAVQEKTSRYGPVKAVVEETPEEVFDESAYVRTTLSYLAQSDNGDFSGLPYIYWISDTTVRMKGFEYVVRGVRRELVNKSIKFDAVVQPAVPWMPDYTDCGFALVDGGAKIYLDTQDVTHNLSLCCNFTNFIPDKCENMEIFGKHTFYGVLREEFVKEGSRNDWFYEQKLELQKVVKLESAPPGSRRIKNGYSCHSNSECAWVSVNCCPEHSGAAWYCLNKEMENYLCGEDSMFISGGCNEGYSGKPSSSCTCQEGKCVG